MSRHVTAPGAEGRHTPANVCSSDEPPDQHDDELSGIGLDVYDSVVSTTSTDALAAGDDYDAWGSTAADAALTPVIGFRGELSIDGDLDLRARQYDPGSGSFTTRDPLGAVDGTTTLGQGYSYAYANNDPLGQSDPTGLQSDRSFAAPVAPVSIDEQRARDRLACVADPAYCVIGTQVVLRPAPRGFKAWATRRLGRTYVIRTGTVEAGRRRWFAGGDCSVIGNHLYPQFVTSCKTHDLGYDLMRYLRTAGNTRRLVDGLLESDMNAVCRRYRSIAGTDCRLTVQTIMLAVRLNSRAQGYRVP
jgi:RHS repeat-associated protein